MLLYSASDILIPEALRAFHSNSVACLLLAMFRLYMLTMPRQCLYTSIPMCSYPHDLALEFWNTFTCVDSGFMWKVIIIFLPPSPHLVAYTL